QGAGHGVGVLELQNRPNRLQQGRRDRRRISKLRLFRPRPMTAWVSGHDRTGCPDGGGLLVVRKLLSSRSRTHGRAWLPLTLGLLGVFWCVPAHAALPLFPGNLPVSGPSGFPQIADVDDDGQPDVILAAGGGSGEGRIDLVRN